MFDRLRVLLTLDDYIVNEEFPSQERQLNLVFTAFAVFIGLWVVEMIAFFIYSFFKGEIFGPLKHRVVLGRHTMDIVSMVIFSYMGFEALNGLGGFSALHTMIINGNTVPLGAARAFVFSASSQRLCVWQVAYEAKNFCDSVIHNDGAIFLAHHLVTGLLSVRKDIVHVSPTKFPASFEMSLCFHQTLLLTCHSLPAPMHFLSSTLHHTKLLIFDIL